MELQLTFANGVMSGDGSDDVGRFLIKGRYDTGNAECHWTKSYIGAHDVFYRGFRQGKGIWGTWEITVRDHGGFHIWPKGIVGGDIDERSEASEKPEPVEAIGKEQAPQPAVAGEQGINRIFHTSLCKPPISLTPCFSWVESEPEKVGTVSTVSTMG